jgi:hypothetical protein
MDQEGSEEIEVVDEIMTSRDKAKRDKLAKELEPKMSRYGKRAKEVAFAIATKQVQGVGGGNKRRDED